MYKKLNSNIKEYLITHHRKDSSFFIRILNLHASYGWLRSTALSVCVDCMDLTQPHMYIYTLSKFLSTKKHTKRHWVSPKYGPMGVIIDQRVGR